MKQKLALQREVKGIKGQNLLEKVQKAVESQRFPFKAQNWLQKVAKTVAKDKNCFAFRSSAFLLLNWRS